MRMVTSRTQVQTKPIAAAPARHRSPRTRTHLRANKQRKIGNSLKARAARPSPEQRSGFWPIWKTTIRARTARTKPRATKRLSETLTFGMRMSLRQSWSWSRTFRTQKLSSRLTASSRLDGRNEHVLALWLSRERPKRPSKSENHGANQSLCSATNPTATVEVTGKSPSGFRCPTCLGAVDQPAYDRLCSNIARPKRGRLTLSFNLAPMPWCCSKGPIERRSRLMNLLSVAPGRNQLRSMLAFCSCLFPPPNRCSGL